MEVIRTIPALTPLEGAAFVPTMGALHEGHLALIRRAAACGEPVLVSIFVNPTQFGDQADLKTYPRRLDRDVALAEDAGATAVFAPDEATIYPIGNPIPVPPLPAVATEPGLEDAHRPGHFAGVCQVVARLFDLVHPRWAVFGEKDYQQLLVIRAMVADADERWGALQIVAHPTVREPDGLAMSSRNARLTAAEREQALVIHRALTAGRGAARPDHAEARMRAVLAEQKIEPEYAVVRDAETLRPVETFDRPVRALIAARIGGARLIDNEPVSP